MYDYELEPQVVQPIFGCYSMQYSVCFYEYSIIVILFAILSTKFHFRVGAFISGKMCSQKEWTDNQPHSRLWSVYKVLDHFLITGSLFWNLWWLVPQWHQQNFTKRQICTVFIEETNYHMTTSKGLISSPPSSNKYINKHNAELQRADPGTKVTG